MPAKDCLFLLGYIATFIGFILFIVGFSRHDWMTHKYGHAGLWVDCWDNNTDCSSSAKAEGPAYLELTRTLMCLALIWQIMGLMGYNFCTKGLEKPKTCKEQFQVRLQELSYFTSGVLIILSVISYGSNYDDYYTETKARTDVDLGDGFYVTITSACVSIVFATVIACGRDTGLKRHLTEQQRALKLKVLKDKESTDSRKHWLQNKKLPSLADQKKKEEDVNDEVVVKESALKRIVMPTNVILAFNRLKSGIGRKQEQAAIDREEKEIEYLEYREASKQEDAESKFKGIFIVEDESQMRPIPAPPALTRRSTAPTPTPKSVRIAAEPDTISTKSSSSSVSSSSSSSSGDLRVTAKDGAVLPSANYATTITTAVKDTESTPPHNTPQRKKVRIRTAMTSLQDNPDSRDWAATSDSIIPTTPPSKTRPKRHLSHDALETHRKRSKSKPKQHNKKTEKEKKKMKGEASATVAIPAKSMYSLPTDEARPTNQPPPPRYEEVIGSQHSHKHHDAPQPVMTKQSRLFQPYSKRS